MCYGNGYLLWERVNKAGKTHKIPCVNRVWAGGKEMGLGERERDQWTLSRWQVELVVVGNLCTGMSRDRGQCRAPPVWSVIQILTVTMTCQPWHALPLPLITSLSWCHHAQLSSWAHQERERDLIVIFSWICTEKKPGLMKMKKCFLRLSICIMNVSWICSPRSLRCYLKIMSLMIKNESCD